MTNLPHATRAAATCLCLAFSAAPALAQDSCGNRGDHPQTANLDVIGLTGDQRLVGFKICAPEKMRDIGTLSGLQAPDTRLVGIDYRVQDGQLYGVGNGGGIYTVNAGSAAATFVRTLTVALDGSAFGVDFNPAANALRIVSNTGQDLRQPFATPGAATVSDGFLNYATGVTAAGIAGAAYTNNDLDPNTATTLFDIDTVLDQVVIQVPPNNGALVATGKLGVDAGTAVGFDIYTRLRDGVTVSNSGFAALLVGGTPAFYRIDLLTGRAVLIGNLAEPLQDIALPLAQ
jgi:hypothetical protein